MSIPAIKNSIKNAIKNGKRATVVIDKLEHSGMVELKGHGLIPYTDATRPITFTIKKSDIEAGKCGDPSACVLAVSFDRQLGGLYDHIIVGKTVLHMIKDGKSKRFWIEGALRSAINTFDKTKGKAKNGEGFWTLPPGEYVLGVVPDKVAKRVCRKDQFGGKGGRKQGLSNVMSAPTRVITGKEEVRVKAA